MWLTAQLDDFGKVQVAADSDALLSRGLAAVVVQALSGLPPAQVLDLDLSIFEVRIPA